MPMAWYQFSFHFLKYIFRRTERTFHEPDNFFLLVCYFTIHYEDCIIANQHQRYHANLASDDSIGICFGLVFPFLTVSPSGTSGKRTTGPIERRVGAKILRR